MKKITLLLFIVPFFVFSQDDLLDELNDDSEIDNRVTSVFKSLKVVNFESTKLANKKDFYLIISHRFGSVKNGIDDFFGLDQAVTQFKFNLWYKRLVKSWSRKKFKSKKVWIAREIPFEISGNRWFSCNYCWL